MPTPSERDYPITSANDRRAIEAGETRDKVTGFDPAAVPMETDAEAGGAPTVPDMTTLYPGVAAQPDVNATSHGSAMRPNGTRRASAAWPLGILIGVVALAALFIFGGFWHH
ncbi:hypothetical protein [Mesorhizobium loti]|uniref:hypothetical protein n=1 Tax=Rhizobium loti TaxID=381 RepID=UPI000687A3DB|nr:hypothetical protein [Mesorhizobium loti]